MTSKVHQTLLTAITISALAGCGSDGPCLQDQNGECITIGETGDDPVRECAPFEEAQVGTSLVCQGEGTGWLVTEIYGAGKHNPITSCLAYAAESVEDIPEYPTWKDCASISLESIPFDHIPTPAACCTEAVDEQGIIDTCELDCGFAAAKTAVAAMREYADALVAPNDILEDAYNVAKSDIKALADFVETPFAMQYLANLAASSPGEVVSVGLGEGPSSPAALGHIKQATLYLGCTLDPEEPYVPNPSVDECSDPTNIPVEVAEQEFGGIIHEGQIKVAGNSLSLVSSLSNIEVATREVLTGDMSVQFTLKRFNASLPAASAGSYAFRNVQIALAGPASGILQRDTVTFAPGALRFSVTATLLVDGVEMFGGLPLTAEYANSAPATAIRALDGSFHFVDATFNVGDYTAVLATTPAALTPIR